MTWYVFRYNTNSCDIEEYNIFLHSGFVQDVQEALTETSKEIFAEKLRRSLQYYFWGKCEYEIIISGWPPAHSDIKRKIDIYEQVMLNWDVFVNYVWSNKKYV